MSITSVVVFTDPETGFVGIMYPNADCGLTISQNINKNLPGCKYHIADAAELPKNRLYLGSWKSNHDETKSIFCDTEASHCIQYYIWREKRKPILERLDLEFMKALEDNDIEKMSEIKDKKRALRDVTKIPLPVWEEGDTVDSFSQRLSSVRPECLSW
jgi:hypothetical protein